jgi:hypothetical protein
MSTAPLADALRYLASMPLRDSLERAQNESDFFAVVLTIFLIPAALMLMACIFVAANWGMDAEEAKAAAEMEAAAARGAGGGVGGGGDASSYIGGGGKRKTA